MKSDQKIFIVDDDAMYTMFTEDHLSSKGYSNISTFSTGEACLESLPLDPKVILLDYNLDADVPGAKNGVEVLEEIRKRDKNLPVIMISAQEAYRGKDTGGDKSLFYVVKGKTSFEDIEAILNNL